MANLRSGSLDDTTLDLVAFERLEQRLEVAFAEPFVALALDELEEHRAKGQLREDLQQQPLVTTGGRTIEQDSADGKLFNVLAVAGQAPVEHPVIGSRWRGHQRYACRAQRIDAGEKIIRQQRDVLDAFAVELHQELFDLPGRLGCLLI